MENDSERELLQKLLRESNSLSDLLRKQNKSPSGTAVKLLIEKLKILDIDYKFIPIKSVKKLTLEDILQKDRPYSSHKLKKRLLASGLKEEKCEICGQEPIWNGLHLELQLDHINGVHNDNRIENLRILCPNCHTQTATFGNKRKKKQNYCIDCGKKIHNKSKRCNSCARKNRIRYVVNPEDRPTKDELFKLIATKTFVEIGRTYNVSDSTIRKWCKQYGLPHTKKDIKMQVFNKIFE